MGVVRARTTERYGPACDIRLLGGFEVAREGIRLRRPSGVPLVAVKLVATCGPLHVEEVAETLWPDVAPETGRRRLRNVLLRVRDAFGDLVTRDEEILTLAEGTTVDARRFNEHAQAALLSPPQDSRAVPEAWEALRVHRGDLLPEDRYREWTVGPRARLHQQLLGILDLLAAHMRSLGRTHETLWLLEYAMDLDPWAEDRYLSAAKLLHEQGLHGRAAAMLARARTMAADLGLPAPEAPWASQWDLELAAR
jgi:DNA-binding SARP family transcriptional activator